MQFIKFMVYCAKYYIKMKQMPPMDSQQYTKYLLVEQKELDGMDNEQIKIHIKARLEFNSFNMDSKIYMYLLSDGAVIYRQ